MTSLPAALLVLATVSTVFCLAVNSYTLRIAYPLWRTLPDEAFAPLHREYLRLLGPVITFPHIVLFFADAALLHWRPPILPAASAWLACTCAWIVVAISAFAAGPIHDRFTRNDRIDQPGMAALLGISAARTLLLLAATILYCQPIFTALQPVPPM